MIDSIRVDVGNRHYEIKEIGTGVLQIMVDAQILANYFPDYSEAFRAAIRRMLDDIEQEMGVHLF